jgi:hypothetical protein
VRSIFCDLCNAPYSTCGELPPKCAACKRDTRWRSKPRAVADATGDPGDENDVPGWKLSEEDYRILRSNRIAPD